MFKYLLISLVSLFLLSSEPTINWSSDYRLQWSDFQAQPTYKTTTVAVTASGITFGYSTKTSNGEVIDYDYTVEAQFYPKSSWYIKARADKNTLQHERLHFDITELYARKLRQRIANTKFTQNFNNEIEALYNEAKKELRELQKLYDAETHHSQDLEKQRYWELKIKQELHKFAAYSS